MVLCSQRSRAFLTSWCHRLMHAGHPLRCPVVSRQWQQQKQMSRGLTWRAEGVKYLIDIWADVGQQTQREVKQCQARAATHKDPWLYRPYWQARPPGHIKASYSDRRIDLCPRFRKKRSRVPAENTCSCRSSERGCCVRPCHKRTEREEKPPPCFRTVDPGVEAHLSLPAAAASHNSAKWDLKPFRMLHP